MVPSTRFPVVNLVYSEVVAISAFISPCNGLIPNAAIDVKIREAMLTGKKGLINTQDLLNAINKINPSTIEWLCTVENYVKYSNQGGMYDAVLDYFNKKENK